jgi:hypothetical protein
MIWREALACSTSHDVLIGANPFVALVVLL